jgi:hypothetical protein
MVPQPNSGGGGSTGGGTNLGTLRLAARLNSISPAGNGQCSISVFLDASGGNGLYSYYKDKDVEDPNFKIVDRYPGDYTYTYLVPNSWGGPVGFIVWSGTQRATSSIWVDNSQTKCP